MRVPVRRDSKFWFFTEVRKYYGRDRGTLQKRSRSTTEEVWKHYRRDRGALQKMKRKPFISFISALVLAMYCVAIVGFDVHTCSHLGRSFVVSLLKGTSCDSIHPESSEHLHSEDYCHCHDCEVAAAEAANSLDADLHSGLYTDSCCSDACHFLRITGVDGNDSNRESLIASADLFPIHFVMLASLDVVCRVTSFSFEYGRHSFGTAGLTASIFQPLFCIWRI